MTYEPHPIDTSHVSVAGALMELSERLAEHNHDIWALNRLRQGWVRGPRRDDERKTHPCLVPYADLPESEKDIDRDTVVAVIKAILASGHEIRPRA